MLDITWLTDANLANTKTFGVAGVNALGTMTWDTANRWITAMNADGGTGYLGINNWRLPTLSPLDGSSTFNTNFSNNGTTDFGEGATGVGWQFAGKFVSEMGYMYYANLANLGICTPNGSGSSSSCDIQAGFGLTNTAPFSNLTPNVDYWSGLEINNFVAGRFFFRNGLQDGGSKGEVLRAWAVRSGDVAATVPEPGSVLLVGAGLIRLIGVKRSKRRGASVI